jgi:hypothetical protein
MDTTKKVPFCGAFKLFCGSFKNRRLMGSHKLSAAVMDDRWYLANNLRKIVAVLLGRFKTPAKLKKKLKKKSKY